MMDRQHLSAAHHFKKIKKLLMAEKDVYSSGKVYTRSDDVFQEKTDKQVIKSR